jgi:ribosomal protein S8
MIVASFCASLQLGAVQKLQAVKVQKNKKVLQLCNLLLDLGYIAGYRILNDYRILVSLKYRNNRSTLRSFTIFSRPSSRVYYSRKNLLGRRVNNYFRSNSFTFFFTTRGILLTDIECFMLGIGGEPVCVVS